VMAMKHNPITGIEDETHIRDELLRAGIRGFRRLSGYKPKVLDVDKIEPSTVSKPEYWSSLPAQTIFLWTDYCYKCLRTSSDILFHLYGVDKIPIVLVESRGDYHCACCGRKVTDIPF